jgi:type IV pilus assembly protein PilN
MRISINLASRPYADLGPATHRLRIGMGVIAVLCLGMGLGLHAVHNKAEQARAREHSLDGQLSRVTNERQGYMSMMREPSNARLLQQTDRLNQIFDEKAFSWTVAMESLETVLPGGVQVTTLEPIREKTGQITLHLRVVGPQNLSVDLVRNLERSHRFLQPRIVGENAADTESNGGSNHRLEPVSDTNRFNFDIQAEYNPPAPQEHKAAKGEEKKRDETPAEAAPGGGRVPQAGHRVTRVPSARPEHKVPRSGYRKPSPATAATRPQGGAR